jgi:hypothetical protein
MHRHPHRRNTLSTSYRLKKTENEKGEVNKMNHMIKAAVVTGFVSAGILVGGSASHAADLGSQTSFKNQSQLSFSGDQSMNLGLSLDFSNQINLSLGSNKATLTSNSNQATTTEKSSVTNNAKLEKGQLQAKTNQSPLNGSPSGTLNANITSNKKVSGSGGASFKWNDGLASAGGYYISLDHQTSRLALETPTLSLTTSSHSVLSEKSTTSPSSINANLNGASELDSGFKNAGLETTMKQTTETSVTGSTNDGKVSTDASSASQFDLLGTLTKAFNLQK